MQKGIYFRGNSSDSAFGMCLIAPSSYSAEKLYFMSRYGNIMETSYNSEISGFCPVVWLKSDIKFTENANGTYTIN